MDTVEKDEILSERDDLLAVIYNLYMLVGQAAPGSYKNGVGELGQGDEGEYTAGLIMEEARNTLREYGVEGIG